MTSSPTRRLAAVLIADVAGYSRLMASDEAGTHARLLQLRADVTDPAVLRHGGRIVRTVGDGLLAEFPSARSALQAAIEIQRAMAERNRGLPKERRIDQRIGINLGDILIDQQDIAGNGVNVAARLETLAEPGGIAISGTVRRQVGDDLGVVFVDAGAQQVKNIARPVRVFRVELDGRPSLWRRLRDRRLSRWAMAAAFALAVVGIWAFYPRPQADDAAASLVVLPFDHPATPAAAALADSMTRQLTGAVSQLTGLNVIAPALAARYGGRRDDMTAISRELKARYALDGRIERVGDEARATVHLVDTRSGTSLWSTRLQSPAVEAGAAPLALVGQLAESLRAAVRTAELKRLAADNAPANAYALALGAADELQKTSDPRQMEAIRARFEHALALDPDHLPALAGYAHSLVYEADRTAAGPMREAVLRRADQVSLRAVTLRPDDAEAWAARTNVLLFRAEPEAAAEAARHGLRLNPYLVPLQSLSGQVSLAQGDGERALAAFDRALALNPAGAGHGVLMHFRCRALLLLARHAEAIESCERAMAFGPEWPDYMVLAAAYALQGDAPQAARARSELLRLQPAFSIRWHQSLGGGAAPSPFDRVLHAGLRKAGVPD